MKQIKDFQELLKFKDLYLWSTMRIPPRKYYYLVSSFAITDILDLQVRQETKRLILNETA